MVIVEHLGTDCHVPAGSHRTSDSYWIAINTSTLSGIEPCSTAHHVLIENCVSETLFRQNRRNRVIGAAIGSLVMVIYMKAFPHVCITVTIGLYDTTLHQISYPIIPMNVLCAGNGT
jgi:hypothetical protein